MRQRIVFLALIAIVTWACDDEDPGEQLEVAVPVNIEEVQLGSIEAFVNSTADLSAFKEGIFMSESEGAYRLQQNPATGKLFKAGDRVRQGQLVIRLVNPEYENNIALESKKLNLDISEREFEKQQSLYEKGGVTLRELKSAERALIDARYAYENALLQQEKLLVRAPFDGIVTNLPYFAQGEIVAPNSELARIMDYSRLVAEVRLPARELGRVEPGQNVRVTQYNLPGDTLYGSVIQADPALEGNSRTFGAQIEVDNPDLKLRPGMFVNLQTIVDSRDSTVVIDRDIILSRRRGNTVFVVEKGAAQERVISIGLENDEQVEVLSGLEAGERLVIKGFETLRHRSKVKVVR